MMWILVVAASFTPISEGTEDGSSATFAPPIRIAAPAAEVIKDILYPTPVLHDMDRDGDNEMILGDLWGHLWVSEKGDDGIMDWSKPEKMKRGEELLKFSNW